MVEHVDHHVVKVHPKDRVELLLHLLAKRQLKRTLIFCRTRRRTGWVSTALRRNGITVGQLHGDRSQAQRRRALAAFSEGDLDVLVATDVASRGLHIPGVRHVVNYDLPNSAEDLVHRAGRAAHGIRVPGSAWTFIWGEDLGPWKTIYKAAGIDVRPEQVDGFEGPATTAAKRKQHTRDEALGVDDDDGRSKGKRRGGKRDKEPGWMRDALHGSRAGGKRRVGPGRRKAASAKINPQDKPGRGIVRPKD